MSLVASSPFRLALITAPAIEPLTLEETRAHLRIDDTDSDDVLTNLISTSRQMVEETTRRALMTQTWRLTLDAFAGEIPLPKPPLQSVTSITYTDPDAAEQTVSTALYDVDIVAQPGRVLLGYGDSWPSDVRDHPGAVKVLYVAGYGSARAAVPWPVRQAMLLYIGHLFENREATTPISINDLPMGVGSLLMPYRIFGF